jgi:hypothetical protein
LNGRLRLTAKWQIGWELITVFYLEKKESVVVVAGSVCMFFGRNPTLLLFLQAGKRQKLKLGGNYQTRRSPFDEN